MAVIEHPEIGSRVRVLAAEDGSRPERWGVLVHWPRNPKERGDFGRALVLHDGDRGCSFVGVERITTVTVEQAAAHRRLWGVEHVEEWARP